jgi:chemotaxis protein MotB
MNQKKIYFAAAILATFIFQSCVPAKKLDECNENAVNLTKQADVLKSQLADANNHTNELNQRIGDMQQTISGLADDTAKLGDDNRQQQSLLKNTNDLYQQEVEQNKMLLSKSSSEKIALSDSLRRKQNDLFRQGKQLDSMQRSLAEREAKLKELQSLMSEKDSASAALKASISKALLGFENSDLSITEKNGKVYVSLAEKLLFKSGSTTIDPKGVDALQKLASVLKKNPDIQITVEGHTDNIPLNGNAAMKDNWDLSVLRATSIVRILEDNGVDSKQIEASGRSQYFPLSPNSTSEGRAQNRRTEIILSPRLDEVMKLLGEK